MSPNGAFKSTLILLGVLFHPLPAPCEDLPYDKSRDSIFQPTPKQYLRELETDRPDRTESPITVDAGHFQLETDLIQLTYDREDGELQRSYVLNNLLLKAGITSDVAFQLIFPTFVSSRSERGGETRRARGSGPLTLRLKWNLFGNDTDGPAMAIMPIVKLPTGNSALDNGKVEGGAALPVSWNLSRNWDLGAMAEYQRSRDEDGDGSHNTWIATLVTSYPIAGKLNHYLELYGEKSTPRVTGWIATFDTGVTYLWNPDLQLDAGVNIGLTRDADDWQPFLGLSFRI